MNIWHKIESKLGASLSDLQQWYGRTGTGEFTLEKIQATTNLDPALLAQALALMAEEGLIKLEHHVRCVNCLATVSEASKANKSCLNCADDLELETSEHPVYIITKAKTRDINWMMVIHGMNTVGTWQQEFSWQLSNYYKHAVPVFIYKYGNIKIKPLLLFSQKRQVKKLAEAIRELQAQAPHGKPDVLAHSYGSLLLSEIINNPKYQDIQFGRIILLGSIVRPDFNWKLAIINNRIEAVMCHHSTQDHIVPLAHYSIPGSGPSGNTGFNDQTHVSHKQEQGFGHSSYFKTKHLRRIFPQVWQPFLTAAKTKNNSHKFKKKWKPNPIRFLTHPIKLLILLIFTTLILLFLVSGYLGIDATTKLLGLG